MDNSIQSYIDNKPKLRRLHSNYKLKIDITVNAATIEIKDNAAGIGAENYEEHFKQQCDRKNKQVYQNLEWV